MWKVTPQLLHLGDQFRQQQLADQQAGQHQGRQDNHQCLGTVDAQAFLQLLNQYIQRHRQDHGTEQHQQNPSQLPQQ